MAASTFLSMSTGPIILFDGACGFCSRVVVFVATRDTKAKFRFAPLQSAPGQQILSAAELPTDRLDTVVLLDGDRVYVKSAAALRIAGGLGVPWSLARIFKIVPRRIRDFVYDLVARNRHLVFRRQDHCLIPAQLEGRVLETEA
jgi:predicted DCC family thiol-disulfide oxidoreductase YuxK